jgi:hypothetical protein
VQVTALALMAFARRLCGPSERSERVSPVDSGEWWRREASQNWNNVAHRRNDENRRLSFRLGNCQRTGDWATIALAGPWLPGGAQSLGLGRFVAVTSHLSCATIPWRRLALASSGIGQTLTQVTGVMSRVNMRWGKAVFCKRSSASSSVAFYRLLLAGIFRHA